MMPLINSGQLIEITPIDGREISKGDIVFCKVKGSFYVHLVSAVGQDGRYQISNNRGHINGWTRTIYGLVRVVD